MAKSKIDKVSKCSHTITLSDETYRELEFISQHRRTSVSSLIKRWAHFEAKTISIEIEQELPDPNQMSFDDAEST